MNRAKLISRREVLQAGAACALAGSLARTAPAADDEASSGKDVKVAVITGRHGYDVPNFHQLFRIGVKFICTRKHDSKSLFRSIIEEHCSTRNLTIKIYVGLPGDCYIAEL